MFFLETLVVLNNKSPSSITSRMNDIFQKTISDNITFKGIGLHSGQKSEIKLLPADENQGIILKELI